MTNTKTAKGMYVVSRRLLDYPFEELHIDVLLDEYGSKVQLRWQRNRDGQFGGCWYACRIETEVSSLAEVKRIEKVAKLVGLNWNLSPNECVERLEKAGYRRAAYHPLDHKFFLVDEWPQGKHYTAVVGSERITSVFASDEHEARRLLAHKAADDIANKVCSKLWISWFVEQTIVCDGESVPPVLHPIEPEPQEARQELVAVS